MVKKSKLKKTCSLKAEAQRQEGVGTSDPAGGTNT